MKLFIFNINFPNIRPYIGSFKAHASFPETSWQILLKESVGMTPEFNRFRS